MQQPLRLLMIEDSPDDERLLARDLRRGGYDLVYTRVDTPAALRSALAPGSWDLVIADWSMPEFTAMEALRIVRETDRDLPFLILSGVVSDADAVAAMKAGAHDYILKGNRSRLLPAIERELREAAVRRRQRRLEQALERSSRMEVVGRFAGQVGAEFQEALVNIEYWSVWLLEHAADSPAVREAVEGLRRATDRAAGFTRQLLSLSRTQGASPQPLDLNALLTASAGLLRQVAGEGISITLELHPALHRVRADASQVEQLILSLVANARESMGGAGCIEIRTENTVLGDDYIPQFLDVKPGRYAALTISDTGRGIQRQLLARIFEPSASLLAPGRDSGLHLSVACALVRQNGGDIDITAPTSAGPVLRVYLPQLDPDAPQTGSGGCSFNTSQ